MRRLSLFVFALLFVLSGCAKDVPPFYGGDDTASDSDTDGDSDSDTDGDSDSDSDCEGNGHDEDGDGLDDNCDNCPSFHNSDQADDDDDGLGNACEVSGDQGILGEIVAFVPFTGDGGDFTTTGGTWNAGDDLLTGSSSPYGEDAYHSLDLNDGAYAVEAVFSFPDDGFYGAKYSGVVFAVKLGDGGTTYWECLFERDSRSLSAWTFDNGYAHEGSTDNVEGSAPPGDWRRIRAIYDGASLTCTFDNELGNTGELKFVAADLWPDMYGRGGIRVYNETADFRSFTIYR